jgi:hypothetical protein
MKTEYKKSKLPSTWQFVKFAALFVGLLIIILQIYALFMQGDNLSTGYPNSRIQHSEYWMYKGGSIFFVGAFMYLIDKAKKEIYRK